MAEVFLKCHSGAKNKKLPYIQVHTPTTTHYFVHDFRIGWGFLFFFFLPSPTLRYPCDKLCFSQSRNLLRDLGQSLWRLLGVRGLFSVTAFWARPGLFTLGTPGLLLGLTAGCLHAAAAPGLLLECGCHKSGKDIQRHTKDFFNEDEFLRVTGGCDCCSGLFFPLPDLPIPSI